MYQLYLVTDDVYKDNIEQKLEQAIKGGVTLVQLRFKNILGGEFLAIAGKVKQVTDKYNVPLIINDRLDVAMAVDAAGVHLGQDDLPLTVARKLWRADKIYGVSTKTVEQALQAEQDGATYIGVGAMFTTTTKVITKNTSMDTLQAIIKNVNIPVVAIGGINSANVAQLQDFDIHGVAVVSCILGAADIQQAASSMAAQVALVLKS